jgi:hypothetical protein
MRVPLHVRWSACCGVIFACRAQAITLRRQEQERLGNLDLQFTDKIKSFEAAHAQLSVNTDLTPSAEPKTSFASKIHDATFIATAKF